MLCVAAGLQDDVDTASFIGSLQNLISQLFKLSWQAYQRQATGLVQ